MAPMSQRDAEIFSSLRPDVLARLVEVRGSIDHAYATIPEEVIRGQFDMVLDRMQSYLASEDAELYRGFAARWMAMRVGDGFSPENLIHSVVAIGDVVARVATERLGPGDETQRFARAVVRMNFVAARMLVEILADELGRRRAQQQQLAGGGTP
jgi:hypothetical protein